MAVAEPVGRVLRHDFARRGSGGFAKTGNIFFLKTRAEPKLIVVRIRQEVLWFWHKRLMAKPKPDDRGAPTDGTYSTDTVAKFLNVAPSYLLKLAAKKIVPRAIDRVTGREIQGRWRLVEANHAYIHYLRDQAFGRGGAEIDWRKENTLLVKAQREKAQFELEVLRAKYVLVEDVAPLSSESLRGW
jgi:hypothetical protein